MPRLSMSVMRVEALGGGQAPPALPCTRGRVLPKAAVRPHRGRARVTTTLSHEGTAQRLATKGPRTCKWVRDVLAILRHRFRDRPDVRHG